MLFQNHQLNTLLDSQQYQLFPSILHGNPSKYVLDRPLDLHSDTSSALSSGTVACLTAQDAGFHF